MPESLGALLLTGGASRRMGRPKAALRAAPGATLAGRTAALLQAVASPVLEVGPHWTALDAVIDEGEGPLVAVARGWPALRPRPSGALIVACDLPRLSEAFLLALVAEAGPSAVVPEVDSRIQPLCGVYPADALDAAVELALSGARSLKDWLAAIPHRVWPADRWATELADVDSPADLLRLGVVEDT